MDTVLKRTAMPLVRTFVLATLSIVSSVAQPVITTVAGTDYVFAGDGKPAKDAQLGTLYSVAVDRSGNVYTGDAENHLIYRISPSGKLSVIGGNGIPQLTGDGGLATQASFAAPIYVAVAPDGAIYIGDAVANVIRRIDPDGTVRSVLPLNFVSGVAVDFAGQLYTWDRVRVYRVQQDGKREIVAGNGTSAFSGDGKATEVGLSPAAVAFDATGNPLIADHNGRIRKVDNEGRMTTIAGGGMSLAEGISALQARLSDPSGIATDQSGRIYVADGARCLVRLIDTDQTIRTIAGTRQGFGGDGGPALDAAFGSNPAVVADQIGNLYIADGENLRVRMLSSAGQVVTIAGAGQTRFSGDGGLAVNATFGDVQGVAISGGELFVSDTLNNRVRKVARDGRISTAAGTGVLGDSGDGGLAIEATLAGPQALAADGQGNVYIAEPFGDARRVRKVRPDGRIEAAAGMAGGQPAQGFRLPASATAVQLGSPRSIAASPSGDLYLLDWGFTSPLMHIGRDGMLDIPPCTVAQGRCPPVSTTGLFLVPSRAASARTQLVQANDGTFYVTVPNVATGNVVNRITPDGAMDRVAGDGRPVEAAQDGAVALSSSFGATGAITLSPTGEPVFAHAFLIDRINRDGTLSRIAGSMNAALSARLGDGGPATAAGLFAAGMQYDTDGNLYIADSLNRRIRKVLALPPSVFVSPTDLAFTARSRGAPTRPQVITITSEVPGVGFQVSLTTESGGQWLNASVQSGATPRVVEVYIDPASLPPGDYTGTVILRSASGLPASQQVSVKVHVDNASPPSASVDRESLSFAYSRNDTARPEVVVLSNSGGGELPFTARVETVSGGPWLKAVASTAAATPLAASAITVTAEPGTLPAQTYRGSVRIIPAVGREIRIPVTMTVSDRDSALALSQTGLTFTAVSEGGVTPIRSFDVLSLSSGSVQWTARTSTISGGADWLQITRKEGVIKAGGKPQTIQVSVSASSLPEGIYYGLVTIDSPGSANTPQVVTVVLQVLPAGTDPGAATDIPELLFSAVAGGPSPGSQSFQVYNVAARPKSYRASAGFDGITVGQIALLPADAALDPSQPTRVVVQPVVSPTASPGVYNGSVDLQFSDGSVRSVRIRLILAPNGRQVNGGVADIRGRGSRTATRVETDGCVPTTLIPAFSSLANSNFVTAGWPVPVEVIVKTDCGAPQLTGSVHVTFSTGDPPLALKSLRDGRWAATWSASTFVQAKATVRVDARDPDMDLSGQSTVSLDVNEAQVQPTFSAASVVSIAGAPPFTPLAPGSVIKISGQNLAEVSDRAAAGRYPTVLANTRVFIAGLSAPIAAASPGEITAVVPWRTGVNTRQQILIRRGTTYSNPVAVDVARAQPAIFLDDVTSQPLISIERDGSTIAVRNTVPAARGDVLLITCAGLGITNPQVEDGEPGPEPASTVSPTDVTVSFGDVEAVVSSAWLIPGTIGRYQVRVTIPSGAPPGDAVPLTIRTLGQISPVVTLPIR